MVPTVVGDQFTPMTYRSGVKVVIGTVVYMTSSLERTRKQRIALRYWLYGAGCLDAVEALDYAESYHGYA